MEPALLPGERIFLSTAANLLIGIDLAAPADPPSTLTGALVLTARSLASVVKGSAIGGELSVTSYRLYFASHGMNWTNGAYSIFLPTIRGESEVDGLISDQLTIETRAASHRFVVRNANKVLAALNQACPDAPPVETLKQYARANLDKVGDGVRPLWNGATPDDALFAELQRATRTEGTNAIHVLGVLTTLELMLGA